MDVSHHDTGEISIWAARGGHGATTVSIALGAIFGISVTSHEPQAAEWMSPRRVRSGYGRQIQIFDRGPLINPSVETMNIVVLRGPCSLGVRSIAPVTRFVDSIILIREPRRAIRRRDIEQALSICIAAEVPQSPRIARLVDAGLLAEQAPDLDEFAELRERAPSWLTAPTPPPS